MGPRAATPPRVPVVATARSRRSCLASAVGAAAAARLHRYQHMRSAEPARAAVPLLVSCSVHQAAGSSFYRHSGSIRGGSRLSLVARRAIYQKFAGWLNPRADHRVLDIGVTSDARYPESNFFEQVYPYKHRLTCVGTEDASHLERAYPGLVFKRVVAGDPLPFADGAFDVAFSNAVIEHVGGTDRQRRFAQEALRVAKRVFLVTPNRLFPVETHTGLPLVHYLPPRLFRAGLRRTRYAAWASEDELNLLAAPSFRRLFPDGGAIRVEYAGVGPGCFKSNLVAYGSAPPPL